MSVRLRFREDARIGPGKVALLEAIAGTGSVAEAGASLHMSARRAWLLIDSLNKAFDTPVVTTDQNPEDLSTHQAEAVLTEFGRALVQAYRDVEADTRASVQMRFEKLACHLTSSADS